uniref:Uncharacterized protein n=1 Tax=Lepeophtheirus salmonis TaxID=72036 RepID=A0A0K2TSE7_LEPSM
MQKSLAGPLSLQKACLSPNRPWIGRRVFYEVYWVHVPWKGH